MTPNVRRKFGSGKVPDERNSVIFMDREILSRTRGGAYLFHILLTTTRNFNEIERIILLKIIIMWNTAVYFDLFQFWEFKSTNGGIEALNTPIDSFRKVKVVLI